MGGVLLVMSVQSCEKADGVVSKGGDGTGTGGTIPTEEEVTGSPLTIGGVMIGGVEINGVITRGLLTKSGLLSKGIGVFRQAATGYSGERNNVEYTNGGSGWGAAAGQKAVYLTKRSATLSVYYPYDSNCSDGKKRMSSCLSSEATDLCYEKGVSAKEGTAVTFSLGHAYARVEFVFSRAEAYEGSCAISGIGISDSNGKLVKSANLDLKSGMMSGQSYGSVSVNPGISGISSGNSATAEVLMVPTTGLGTMTLSFTVDGSEKTATVTSISELKGGKSYKINVEISAAEKVETANCYMVAPAKSITIPVTVKGNGGAVAGTVPSLISSTSINPASVGIVWETATNLITLGSLSNGKVTVTAGSSAGNAVIAAYSGANQSGTILWSWHIWVTDYNPDKGTTYSVTNTGSPACTYVFMDRNLGATSATAGDAGTIGLHYQWGRKDPFTCSSSFSHDTEITVYNGGGTEFKLANKVQTVSASNNLSNSIANPEVFYKCIRNTKDDWYTNANSTSSQNDALWGGSDLATPGEKTIFDPCPAGWRVPAWSGNQSPWSTFTKNNFTWSNYGRIYRGSYYPASSSRDCSSGVLSDTGSYGYYWSGSPYSNTKTGSAIVFKKTYVYPPLFYVSGNSYGLSVRCVKE
jgi:hypothetical protein